MAELTSAQRALVALREMRKRLDALENARPEPVAIVGMACRFPGGVRTPEEYWRLLESGRDAVTEVPASRWDVDAYYSPDPGRPGKMYTKAGGFIDGVYDFDRSLFGISEREAASMDPQQRILLQTAWEALERAGIRPRGGPDAIGTGAFFGVSTHDYSKFHLDSGRPEVIDEHSFTGSAFSILSGRVAHALGLQGPTLSVDTACSSSLVAVHLACNSLLNGECHTALAGGVNLLLTAENFVYFCKTAALSPSGRCHSFDQRADGYVRAEGCGVVVLQRLSRAIREGHRILAVIRASGVNHDGTSHGLTAPNGVSQRRLLRHCLTRAGLRGGDIGYVEAHGTGTPLGDPIELGALGEVLAEGRAEGAAACRIGTCKANLGHLEAAAGVAGLMRAVLSLEHETIAPQLHFRRPNPHVAWDDLPVAIPTEREAWPRTDEPRRAGVSSFGFGGTNAHVVLEEAPVHAEEQRVLEEAPVKEDDGRPTIDETPIRTGVASPDSEIGASFLFILSAPSPERLAECARQILEAIRESDARGDGARSLRDVAYTLQVGREPMEERLAVVAADRDELERGLRAYMDGGASSPGGVPVFLDGHAPSAGGVPVFRGSTRRDSGSPSALHGPLDREGAADVARRWVAGETFAWRDAYVGAAPSRVLLPTYPFQAIPCGPLPTLATAMPATLRTAAPSTPASDGVTSRAPASDAGPPLEPVRDRADRVRLIKDVAAYTLGIERAHLDEVSCLAALEPDSISLVKLRYALEVALEAEVPLSTLVDAPSWDALAGAAAATPTVNEVARDRDAAGTLGVRLRPEPEARYEPFPLTDLQEAFLVGRFLGPDKGRVGCHLYLELNLRPGVDDHRATDAWRRLIERHDMLRTVVEANGTQRVLEAPPAYEIPVHRLVDRADAEVRRREIRERLSHRVYDPGSWPHFAVEITRVGDDGIVHLSVDEWIVDGACLARLLEEWWLLYSEPERSLPEPEILFRDYVLAQKRFEKTARFARDLSYWTAKGPDLPSGPSLPVASDARRSGRRRRLAGSLPRDAWSRLKERSRAWRATPTVALLSAFDRVLRDVSMEPGAFSLTLTFFNRLPIHPRIDEMMGPAASTLLFVADAARETPIAEVAGAYQRKLWEDLEHASVSSVRAMRELRAAKVLPRDHALPVVFTSMIENLDVETEACPWSLDGGHAVSQTPQVLLDCQVFERDGCLRYQWDLAEDVLDTAAIEAAFGRFAALVEELARTDPPVRSGAGASTGTASEAAAIRDSFPLNDLQTAYVVSRLQDPARAAGCSVYQEFEVTGLDMTRLQDAIDALIRRHDMLRAVVLEGGRQQVADRRPPYVIREFDVVRFDETLAETRVRMSGRVFRLGEWPLFELAVTHLAEGTSVVHLCIDMLIADGASICRLHEQLWALYSGVDQAGEGEGEGAGRSIPYEECRAALASGSSAEEERRDTTYWEAKLRAIAPGPRLPRPTEGTGLGGPTRHRFTTRVHTLAELEATAARFAVPLESVVFTAFAESLRQWHGSDAFTIVVVDFDRATCPRAWLDAVGDFTFLHWIEVTPQVMPLLERARRWEADIQSDRRHASVSGLKTLRKVALRRGPAASSFPVVFTRHAHDLRLPASGEVRLGPGISTTPGVAIDGLMLKERGSLHLHWDVDLSLVDMDACHAMFRSFVLCVEALSEDPSVWTALDVSREISLLAER